MTQLFRHSFLLILCTFSGLTLLPQASLAAVHMNQPVKAPQDPAKLRLSLDVATLMYKPELERLKEKLIAQSLRKTPPEAAEPFRRSMEELLDLDDILARYASTQATYYSTAELEALKSFMSTPAGQSVMSKLPTVMTQMQLDRQQYFEKVLKSVLENNVLQRLRRRQ